MMQAGSLHYVAHRLRSHNETNRSILRLVAAPVIPARTLQAATEPLWGPLR